MTVGLDLVKSPLKPVLALNVWTFVMAYWMYRARINAVRSLKLGKPTPQFTREWLYSKIPPEARWPNDNYNHLLEQPTQFYAVVLALVFLQDDSKLTLGLAWGYVGIRIVHSLVQSLYNNIMWRIRTFGTGTFIVMALTGKAVWLIL